MTSTSSGTGSSRTGQRPGTSAPADYPSDEFDVDHEPGRRRGAHRTATPAVVEQLPFLLVALAVVVTIVIAFGYLAGGEDPGASAPDAAPGSSATADPTPGETTSPPGTTEPPASSSDAPPADRSVSLVVLNGTSTAGLAGEVGAALEELGWTVGTVGNAPQQAVETSVVLYSEPDQQGTAEAVAADLEVAAELDDSADGQVVVLVGADRS